MKRIFLGVLAAWSAIVALAWWLADERIDLCSYERDCVQDATAIRDAVLIWGASIPLGVFVLALFLGLVRLNRQADGSTSLGLKNHGASGP